MKAAGEAKTENSNPSNDNNYIRIQKRVVFLLIFSLLTVVLSLGLFWNELKFLTPFELQQQQQQQQQKENNRREQEQEQDQAQKQQQENKDNNGHSEQNTTNSNRVVKAAPSGNTLGVGVLHHNCLWGGNVNNDQGSPFFKFFELFQPQWLNQWWRTSETDEVGNHGVVTFVDENDVSIKDDSPLKFVIICGYGDDARTMSRELTALLNSIVVMSSTDVSFIFLTDAKGQAFLRDKYFATIMQYSLRIQITVTIVNVDTSWIEDSIKPTRYDPKCHHSGIWGAFKLIFHHHPAVIRYQQRNGNTPVVFIDTDMVFMSDPAGLLRSYPNTNATYPTTTTATSPIATTTTTTTTTNSTTTAAMTTTTTITSTTTTISNTNNSNNNNNDGKWLWRMQFPNEDPEQYAVCSCIMVVNLPQMMLSTHDPYPDKYAEAILDFQRGSGDPKKCAHGDQGVMLVLHRYARKKHWANLPIRPLDKNWNIALCEHYQKRLGDSLIYN